MGDPVSLTLMAASTALQFVGGMQQAAAAKSEANYNASIMRQNAKQEFARGSLAAQEEMKQGELLRSKALANAAKGGGAGDVSVQEAIGDIEGQTHYNALMRAYEGEQGYKDLNANAALTVVQGKQKSKAYRTEAFSTLLGGAGKMASGMGGGGGGSLYGKYSPQDAFRLDSSTHNQFQQPIKWS